MTPMSAAMQFQTCNTLYYSADMLVLLGQATMANQTIAVMLPDHGNGVETHLEADTSLQTSLQFYTNFQHEEGLHTWRS